MENGMFDENVKMGPILYDAKIGLWHIEMDEGKPERMYANRPMLELLGLDGIPTPEECYRHWHSRIEKESLGLVEGAVQTMAAGQHGEISYPWYHPKKGKIYVRCGGTRDMDYTQGLRFHGYHQDVSEIVSLQKETEKLRGFQETMLLSLKDLYLSVMILEIDTGKVYPIHLSPELGAIFAETSPESQDTEGMEGRGGRGERQHEKALKDMVRFYHPEEQEEMRREITIEGLESQMEQGKEKIIWEYRRNIRGEYHWVSIVCYFMPKLSKNRMALIAIQDIDEIKRQEKEYQEYLKNRYNGNMEILRMSLKNTNILEYFYYPKEGRVVLPEKTACYYGCKEEYWDVEHDFARDLVDMEYYGMFCNVHEYIQKGGKNGCFYYGAKRGKFWCKCSISSVNFDEWGNTVFAVGIIEDLTKQREMERDNERYQSIYKFTVDTEYDGIGIINVETGETDVKVARHINPKRLISQGTFEEVKMRFIDLFLFEEDKERYRKELTLESILGSLGQTEDSVRYYFRSGEEFGKRHKQCTIRYFNEERTKLFVCIRDIEHQVRSEAKNKEELERAFESAEQANRAKSDFLSKMSHDIRTPMNAIVGMASIAKANMGDRERVEDCLSKITIASNHLTSLVNEVLDMSRIESGKMDLAMEEFDLVDLAGEVAEVLQPKAFEKNQQLIFKLSGVQHRKVIGDGLSLRKVFHNILGNAVKYTQRGGKVSFQVEELPSLHHNYGYYRFTIEDNGFGMSEEFQQKLFEPFERSQDPRVESMEGTGLGMPITRNLVQLMQGDIEVESQLDKGSKFTITLFLSLQEGTGQGPLEAQEEGKEPSVFPGKRALLVEDNELNVEIAIEILKMFELDAVCACNGKEAVESYQGREPGYFDIIFMDIQMPVMDGYTAAKAIRSSGREDSASIPIVAMTANAFSEDVQKAIHTGMNAHVAKPIDIKHLAKVLAKWLA